MTTKAQSLLSQLGDNMAESLGRRQPEAVQGAEQVQPTGDKKYDGRTRSRDAGEMLLANIIPDPLQPRKEFDPDGIARLADSLKDRGQLQPIRVRWSEEHLKWVILAGERRYRAALQAGFTTIACVFVEHVLSDIDRLEIQLIENCLRDDLRPIEQANAFSALMRHNDWTAKELAEHLHLDRSSITRALALLTLPDDVQHQITEGTIAPSIGYEIAKLDDPVQQRDVVDQAVTGQLSRDKVVEVVNAKRGKVPRKSRYHSCTLTYKTDKKWTIVLTAPQQKVSNQEILDALHHVAETIRAKMHHTPSAA
jgi:ParB family transcriptional regulator, chromosome partitioning protein